MPYVSTDRNLAAIAKMLPREAMATWCDAANTAEDLGVEHNDCVRAAWDEVNKTWKRPATGKKWVRKDDGGAAPAADAGPGADAVHVDGPLGAKKKPQDDEARKFEIGSQVCKVDDALGIVLGWAIVCTENGEPYFDTQGDFIPDDSMLKAAADFMLNSRISGNMHARDEGGLPVQDGSTVFMWPMTADVAKAMGVDTPRTGLMIGIKPSSDVLAKYRDGSYTGFSIGGHRVKDELVSA